MKIRDYIDPLIKWWWLLVIATAVAGTSAYMATKPLPPIYRAQASMMVGSAIDNPNPSGTEYGLSIKLAEGYSLIAGREQVRQATMKALGLNSLPEYSVTQVGQNQLLDISVIDTNPQRAQAVANEIANQLIKMSPTSSDQQNQQRLAFINKELDDLQQQISSTKEQLLISQDKLKNLQGAVEIADAEAEQNALERKLTLLENNYATLLSSTQSGAINTLSLIDPAGLPTQPIGPNKPMIILAASMVGLVLAAGAANLLEYMDRTIKIEEDVSRLLDLPVFGYISDMGKNKDNWAYVANHPRSPVAEAFRALRANIEFAGVDKPLKRLLITSADTEDGKTTVATNLAMIMSQSDKRVIVVDADLRRPSIHRTIDIPAQPGLSDVFRDRAGITDVVRYWNDKRIGVITSGNTPPNPAELLASRKMDQILMNLEEAADIMVIDGPPVVVTDSTVLSTKVDGVLMVIRPGQTREEVAQGMLEQLRRVGANVIGVVLNRIPRNAAGYYGAYPYYSPYYNNDKSDRSEDGSAERVLKRPNRSAPDLNMATVKPAEKK